jgi:hypothetical protein
MPQRLIEGLTLVSCLAGCAFAQEDVPAPSRARAAGELPVREVTVFKDGHAFLLREGALRPEDGGRVVLEQLPEPVLGTFWPYAGGGARIVSATASRERVRGERTALDLRQVIEANAEKDVVLATVDGELVEGRLIGLPRRGGDEVERSDPEGGRPRLAETGSVVLLATATGTKALPIERVRELEVRGPFDSTWSEEALQDRLTLHVEGASSDSSIGVAYVQRGLRWIPAYEIDVDGAGTAAVRLEATLVNDLIDLEDATVHLVIGVPRFEFAGELDPICLQQAAARIASRLEAPYRFDSLSNALMTQAAGYVPEPAAPAGGAEVVGGDSEEDLYLFTLPHVTLRKGERMVLPVSSFRIPYRDVYVLDVPFGPPIEMRDQLGDERALELARLLAAPRAMHVLRLENKSDAPLTTAPALVRSRGRVLAQGLLTYAPSGATTDLSINAAVDVRVTIDERETGRTPEAMRWAGDTFARTDLAVSLEISNEKGEPIEVEVRRSVLGLVDEVGQEGKLEQGSLSELWDLRELPEWWSWYGWPTWWLRWNGIGRFTWTARLGPGEKTTLTAKWHYFWR